MLCAYVFSISINGGMRARYNPAMRWILFIVINFGTVAVSAELDNLRLTVLSSRPELVSGGDALVRIAEPGVELKVLLNDQDITSSFHRQTTERSLVGLVTGLRQGTNELLATSGAARASLQLVNYPITGPIISGPHEQPYICETERFKLQSGATLGPPLDANCSIRTRIDYYYRTPGSEQLKPLLDPSAPPPDVAQITTLTGASVPYVIRIETGTINRAVYQIASLQSGWNQRLIYTFGGGCPGGWYRQGNSTGGVDNDVMLSRGYAVASASLNVFGNNCNDLLAAETMMMVKERVIESQGLPLFTIGWGCSGGSYQSHQIGDNYPGLLDGIIVGCSFPDVGHAAISAHSFGARLMYNYFQTTSVPWTKEEQVAASGMPDYQSLEVHGTRPDRLRPRGVCSDLIPPSLLYDPEKNPKGARCTVFDHTVNVYGRDDKTGFARRFLDNVGVQYGLKALNTGTISKQQFLDLNEKIGGIDADAEFVPTRTTGDRVAIRIAYESGRILNGGGGLSELPIIDYRGYSDFTKGDIHMQFHSFSTRERLIRANGHARNHIMLIEDGRTYGGFSTRSPVLREALTQMEQWLTAITNDSSNDPRAQKIVHAKPAELVDACYDATGAKIVEPLTYSGTSPCNTLYPSHGSPYLAAGMPLANDVVKCQLKSIDVKDYAVEMTPIELDRLQRIFPDGVCDYTKPGIEQRPLRGTWLSFGPSPVNR